MTHPSKPPVVTAGKPQPRDHSLELIETMGALFDSERIPIGSGDSRGSTTQSSDVRSAEAQATIARLQHLSAVARELTDADAHAEPAASSEFVTNTIALIHARAARRPLRP